MSARLEPEEVARRARALTWFLTDVDGVLTDGTLDYGRAGENRKRFHVRDGLGLQLLRRAGLRVGVLTSRESPALDRRAEELALDVVLAGRADKWQAFEEFQERFRVAAQQVAFVADDLPDLKVLARAGLALAPADAAAEVQAVAHVTLSRRGGRGAVREAAELILRARGDWERLLAGYTFAGD